MRHSRAHASSPRRAISKPTPAEASLGLYLKLMQSPSTTTRNIRLANDPERLQAPCTALRRSTPRRIDWINDMLWMERLRFHLLIHRT